MKKTKLKIVKKTYTLLHKRYLNSIKPLEAMKSLIKFRANNHLRKVNSPLMPKNKSFH